MEGDLLDREHPESGGWKLGLSLLAIFLAIWVFSAWTFELQGIKAHITSVAVPAPPRLAHPIPYSATPPAPPLGLCLYRGLQLFHLDDKGWPEPDTPEDYIARFLAAAYGFSLPLIALGWFFRGGLQRWWHESLGRKFVTVIGSGNGARQLAADIARCGRRVIWVRTKEKDNLDKEKGVLIIAGALDDPVFWVKKVRIRHAAEAVIMAGDDSRNIEISLTIEDALGAGRIARPLPCHIHLADLHLKKGMVSLLPNLTEAGSLARCYFNHYEMMARVLARQHPVPAALSEQNVLPEHYIIVGFGQFGQNVALKLVKMGQQVVRRKTPAGPVFEVCKPRITIVDKDGPAALETFERSYPGFEKTCELNVVQHDCRQTGFLDLRFLQDRVTDAHRSLFFCLENEVLVVSAILLLMDASPPAKHPDSIYFWTAHDGSVGHLISRQQEMLSKSIKVITFATDDEVFTEDVILGHSLDLMARRVHEAYLTIARGQKDENNNPPAAGKDWAQLSEDERDGNREPADHMWAKVRSLGFDLETLPPGSSRFQRINEANNANLINAINDHMDELAGSEHYRWMAWRLIHGWKFGKPRDNVRKLHPDIIAYESLTEETQNKDKVIVSAIPDLMNLGRLRAVAVQK